MNPLLAERMHVLRNAWVAYQERQQERAFLLLMAALLIGLLISASAKLLPGALHYLDDPRLWLLLAAGLFAQSYSASTRRVSALGQSWWRVRVLTRAQLLADLRSVRALEMLLLLAVFACARPTGLHLFLLTLIAGAAAWWGPALALGSKLAVAASATIQAVDSAPRHAVALSARLPIPYIALTQWAPARWGKPAQIAAVVILVSLPNGLKGVTALVIILTIALLVGLIRAFAHALEQIAQWHRQLQTLPYSRSALIKSLSLRPALLVSQAAALMTANVLYAGFHLSMAALLSLILIAIAALLLAVAFAFRDDRARMQLRLNAALMASIALPIAIGPWAMLLWLLATPLLLRRALKI